MAEQFNNNLLDDADKITGYIYSYSRKARDIVIQSAEHFLLRFDIIGISACLFSCVDELVKNAVKANYKFIIIFDEIYKNMRENYPEKTSEEIKKEISDILKVQESFDHMANEILKEKNVSTEVREILNEEAKLLSIKDKAYKDKREYSTEEKEAVKKLKKLDTMKKRVIEEDIKIILKMQINDDYIYIEVTNTAPIITRDLNRIYKKRDEYKKYRDEAREHEFFVNNLDTSESGFGLGYATIDSILCDWGLDPDRAATIISAIDTTVLLSIPVTQLKKS